MTRIEALADYANAYRAYQVFKGSTFNIDVATSYAVQDMNNQTKHHTDANAIFCINDEALWLREAMA